VPIYEYACKECDNRFEKLVRSMGSDERVDCPSCGSKQTARTMSVFAVAAAAEGGKKSNAASAPGMYGRCGGPGPCATG